MSRKKRKLHRRYIEPDFKYKSIKVAKFINCLLLNGKKRLAERIVYLALEKLAEKSKDSALDAFETVLKHVTPRIEVKSRRVGGATYQVPVEVHPDRGMTLAIRWIISNSRARKGKSMVERLSSEFIDSYHQTGSSVKKRDDTHKMAESNKAFSHFRW